MQDEFGSDLPYKIETTDTGYKVTYFKSGLFSGYKEDGTIKIALDKGKNTFTTEIGTIEINLNGNTLYSDASATTVITSLDLVNAMYYTYNESFSDCHQPSYPCIVR